MSEKERDYLLFLEDILNNIPPFKQHILEVLKAEEEEKVE